MQGSYDEMVAAVAKGQYNCAVADVTITSAREKTALFTTPYFSDYVQVGVALTRVVWPA